MLPKYLNPIRVLNGVTNHANSVNAKFMRTIRYQKARKYWTRVPLLVNVGCGDQPIPGWVNLDLDRRYADIIWDATGGLPFPNDSCSFIYNEHFLEHLAVKDGVHFLTECHRILRPGGVVRVAVPSLRSVVDQYLKDDWRDPWMQENGYAWIQTRAEAINIGFRNWGHQWLYDAEELERRMREAGFTNVESAILGDSKYAELRSRETRPGAALIMEATKN